MNMRTAGSLRLQNDVVEDNVPMEENVDSTDDSLLPPPETSEGSKVGFVVDDDSILTAARPSPFIQGAAEEELYQAIPIDFSPGGRGACDEPHVIDDDSCTVRNGRDASFDSPGKLSVLHSELEIKTCINSYMHAATSSTPVHYKNKVDRRINEALARCNFAEQRRSADLVPLSQDYQKYRKELRKLIITAKEYMLAHEKVVSMRAKMMDQCVTMSTDTPMFEHVGRVLENDTNPNKNKQDDTVSIERLLETEGPLSLASIEQLHKFYSETSIEEFSKYVLNFASDWEQSICNRLDQEITIVANLQKRKIHYERKVNRLRRKVNCLEGKDVAAKLREKLTRNEQRLDSAWTTHETRSAQLCFTLEECVHNGYKDLHTFMKNWSRFEINKTSRTEILKMKLKINLVAMKANDFDAILRKPDAL